jgi:hypothetical protein
MACNGKYPQVTNSVLKCNVFVGMFGNGEGGLIGPPIETR